MDSTPLSSASSSAGSSNDHLQDLTPATTAPSSPKLPNDELNLLPSPFYPPSYAQVEGAPQRYETPALPAYYPALPSAIRPSKPDEKDLGTPDEGIIRDEKLVRLTGRWPMNCEPSLPDLWNSGFLTPTRLFYVRNHGAVPRVTQAEGLAWELEISGMINKPCTLTLADLLNPSLFQPVTLPVTLVCAGNRRKEQNVVRKSLGFNWGAAGLSTALFTGVYLADVLEYVQPRNEGKIGHEGFRRAEHVCFEGAESLPKGPYGTSQKLRWAQSRSKGMMLAWAMNGEALEPDHGFPLRLVVPGQIGGRSVKWLKKIIVSDKESEAFLHYFDNRMLPSTLMPEQARAEDQWWYDPRYLINDLNTNSAIAQPAHDEQVVMPSDSSATYSIQGYAYAGAGSRVTRVEITLDDGETWLLCDIKYPEDEYRQMPLDSPVWGTLDLTDRDECFCWCFWKLDVPLDQLKGAGSIAVRAMDERLQVQGKTMYWNATGMMNNWWFRIAIHKTIDAITGGTTLRFEHPTLPGTQDGGWMERLKEEGKDVLNPSFTEGPSAEDTEILTLVKESAVVKKVAVAMTKASVNRKITMEELAAHNKEDEPWFVVHGEVYDGTGFLKQHPGGAESITIVAGQDATEDFMAIHSIDAKRQLSDYHIGTLIPSTSAVQVEAAPATPDPVFLSKTKFKRARLVKIDHINHDSRNYRFELEYPEQELGLPTGQHVYARLRRKVAGGDAEDGKMVEEGEMVQRAYTPVSSQDARGFLDMLIKVYFRTPQFPEGGKMTLGFEELHIGDYVEFKGPLGSFKWLGQGVAEWRGVKRSVKKVGLICGGSGITPIIQVIRGIVHDSEDTDTEVYVINANREERDILLRYELEELAQLAGPSRFKQHLVLSKATESWQGSKGRITKAMLAEHLPPPDENTLICVCGPDPMIVEVVKPGLAELGWDVTSSLVIF